MTHPKMEINAALQTLVTQEGDLSEAARVVINFGSGLKSASPIRMNTHSIKKNGGENIHHGYALGVGNVSRSEDDDTPSNITEEKNFGYTPERVGHYRLWKQKKGVIRFHHFWKSSLTTMVNAHDKPSEYCLAYNPKSLEPIFFAIERRAYWWKFYFSYLESLYGKIKDPWNFLVLGFYIDA